MISERNCFVYIVLPGSTEFVTAARFQVVPTRDGNVIGEFIYGKKYLARTDAVALDPVELKLGTHQYETVRMHGYFGAIRDAMPDFWGRQVIQRNVNKLMLDEFDYLMYGADDRAGALGFGLNVEPPAPKRQFSRTLDLAVLQQIADDIINDVQTENNIVKRQVEELLLEGTSMGGARPKAVIEEANSLWIAKFSSAQDNWNQPRVEHAILKLAKLCGLHVADSKIVSVAGKDVLLVRRFDRDKIGAGYRRCRMVSALTLLQSDDSPLARENWSYLLLAEEIRRVSDNPTADLRELFCRMCFNAVISNLDDHPRNHAILAKENNWRLSPAYDLTPSLVIAEDTRFLAMTCGMNGRAAKKGNLLSGHKYFFLTREEAENILDNIIKIVKNEWHKCLRRAGVSERDCETLARSFVYSGFFL